jgi:valyl-tRNA synthetase
VVEPMLSYQWFVRVNQPDASGESLTSRAIKAVETGATTFHPKFWENTYFSWMRNLNDWCISRQLWWGHRIPAYWCESCRNPQPIVAEERPASCPQCGGKDLRQDDDVLDTWFSSGLWPFSTLGWPDQTQDLKKYYPTSLLITGFDIIFFWVARMMMFALKMNPTGAAEMKDAVPFRDVFITPLVRDQYGKKMSKSRGNVVDPIEIMDKYGTDAVRFTLAQLMVQGRDLILSEDRLAASRAFANKIWNAARFVLMNLDGAPQPIQPVETAKLGLAERWIMSRLDHAIGAVSFAIDSYEFNTGAMALYQFIWHEFCDWYIELAKEPLKAGGEKQAAAHYVLVTSFDRMLRVLHPFMPFISEELWQTIRPYLAEQNLSQHLAIAQWPLEGTPIELSDDDERLMRYAIDTIEQLNSLRALVGYKPGDRPEALVRPLVFPNGAELTAESIAAPTEEFVQGALAWRPYVITLAKVKEIDILGEEAMPPFGTISVRTKWGEVHLREPEGFDRRKVSATLEKKRDELQGHCSRFEQRLANPEFAKAGVEKRIETEERIVELRQQIELLDDQLAALSNPN